MASAETTSLKSASSARAAQFGALGLLLAGEIAIFALVGTGFWTTENGIEIVRSSVEIGLLALAMTLVIVSGGIDLSVGSLMGLSAVVCGKLWRDANVPMGVAAACTLAFGAAAGSLNATLITRFRLPALIVTLGSFSLFRGLAEGITRGRDAFTELPKSFTDFGQSYYFNHIPPQLVLFVIAAVGAWILLHRTPFGRGLSAIGYSPDGARHGAVPVERRIATAYILSGATAALAGLIYMAHVGQGKASVGEGYELEAITAVVLGGTSIFGGRGTMHGTVLGVLAIAVLKNGISHADLSSELAGVLTGALLLTTISLDWWLRLAPSAVQPTSEEEFEVKNSQVAVLAVVILMAGGLIAGTNWYLVRALRDVPVTSPGTTDPGPGAVKGPSGRKITVAMMPKSKENPYFIACRKGAEEAAKELGVELLWDGPTASQEQQNQFVENWITRGVDVIAVAVEDRGALSDVLRKAQKKGIKVITWDADAEPDARTLFVNQATPQGIGYALMDNAAKVLHEEGEFAVITGSLTAANLNEWFKYVEERNKEKYPKMKRIGGETPFPCDDKKDVAFTVARDLLDAHPNMKLIMAICSPAVPGAARAVEEKGRKDVKVIGLGLPNENNRYVKDGITESVILWNTMDLGYLTVHAAQALAQGKLKVGDKTFTAGRLKQKEMAKDNLLLGQPFIFTKENIDQFDF